MNQNKKVTQSIDASSKADSTVKGDQAETMTVELVGSDHTPAGIDITSSNLEPV